MRKCSISLEFMHPMAIESRRHSFVKFDQFVMPSKWVVLAGDWNTVFDPDLDCRELGRVLTFLLMSLLPDSF